MNDALGVRRIQSVGGLHGGLQHLAQPHRFPLDAVFQGLPVDILHDDVGSSAFFSDVIDSAYVGVIES